MLFRATLIGVVFAATSVLQPAHANADPDNDFLAWLNGYGIDLSALMGHPISQQDTIELGQDIAPTYTKERPRRPRSIAFIGRCRASPTSRLAT